MNPWLPPCERVGGERHANPHLRSSRGTVRGEVRWREVGGLRGGSTVARSTGPILTMDRRLSAVLTRVFAARARPSCDDDDMPGWIRSYWDEEELTFVGAVGDDG